MAVRNRQGHDMPWSRTSPGPAPGCRATCCY